MPKITYVEHDGTAHVIDVASGMSVMEGAVRNGVPGIDADCGGACSCATCHVYIGCEWAERISPASEDEKDMLEFASDVDERSRLACQIMVEDTHDGLVVAMPASQSA